MKKLLFLCLFLVGCNNGFNALRDLDTYQKNDVCKTYIAAQFGQLPGIMNIGDKLKMSGAYAVEVFYNRPFDDQSFSYLCYLSPKAVVWATYENGNIGRWRIEDKFDVFIEDNTITIGKR